MRQDARNGIERPAAARPAAPPVTRPVGATVSTLGVYLLAGLSALLASAGGCGSAGGPGQEVGGAVGEAAGSVAGGNTIKPVEAGQEVGGTVGRAAGEAAGAAADRSGRQ